MLRADVIVGGTFLLLGCGLIVSGAGFPPGVGGLPGAGFFPQAIGSLMALLAGPLLLRGTRQRDSEASPVSNVREVSGTAALLFAYLLLWGSGLFFVRTALFLVVMLRFLGQRWIPAVCYSAALVAFVYAAFDVGLNVSLE